MSLHIQKKLILLVTFFLITNSVFASTFTNGANADWIKISDALPTQKSFNSLVVFNNQLYSLNGNNLYQFNGNILKPVWNMAKDGASGMTGNIYSSIAIDNHLYAATDGKFSTYTEGKGWTSLNPYWWNWNPNKFATMDGRIFALAGYYNDVLSVYDINHDSWSNNIGVSGNNSDMVVFGNKLYVSGPGPAVFVYDPSLPANNWKDISNGLSKNTSLHTSLAIANGKLFVGFENITDKSEEPRIYTYNGNNSAPDWIKVDTTNLSAAANADKSGHGYCSNWPMKVFSYNDKLYAAGTASDCRLYIAVQNDKNKSVWYLPGKKIETKTVPDVTDNTFIMGFNNVLYVLVNDFHPELDGIDGYVNPYYPGAIYALPLQ